MKLNWHFQSGGVGWGKEDPSHGGGIEFPGIAQC